MFASIFKLATGKPRHPIPDHVGETIELANLITAGVKDGTVELANYIEFADVEPAVPAVTAATLQAAVDMAMAAVATQPAEI